MKEKGVIKDIYDNFVSCASGLGDYQAISKTDLANGYCDADEAHDEIKRSQYMAALMLRYWYKIYEWNKEKNLRLELEDFVSWLYESFEVAFEYRRWRDPNDKLYNDPNGPDKVFNRAFYSTRNRWYDYFNKDKRRINYYTYSLEESVEIHGDGADGLGVVDESSNENVCGEIIQSYLDQGKILEAIVLDSIINENVFKENKTRIKTGEMDEYQHPIVYESYSHTFDMKKLVKSMTHVSDTYINKFKDRYEIDPDIILPVFEKLKHTTPKKLTQNIENAMMSFREDKELLGLLC